tara:strand:+ start:5032 stop:5634 length:603 start_codon:yes stop_codon:yes gene_type:complete
MRKQIISKILIGTNNQGKLKEIRDLLPKRINIFSTTDFKLKSPNEIGKTFRQNSYLKAKYFSKKTNLVCLADDSGLEIKILNNKPGIYSARWGGKKNNFNLAINKVFKELDKKDPKWKSKKVKARFICDLTIYWPNGKSKSSFGTVNGTLSNIKKGKMGFGYDPIFIPDGHKKTFGEMVPKRKNKIDHRYVAFQKIKKFF